MNWLKKISIDLFCLLFLSATAFSQVTIGTNERPASGALLQLKNITDETDGSANATKGLLLSRVAITDLVSLVDISNADQAHPELYVGLMVYNPVTTITLCNQIPEGIYTWDSQRWTDVLGRAKRILGSTQEDMEALKNIVDTNPGNTLGWTIDLNNIDNPNNFQLSGVTWSDVCGKKRVTGLAVNSKKLELLDLGAFTALTSLSCNSNQLKALDLTQNRALASLNCSDNLITGTSNRNVTVCETTWNNWDNSSISPAKSDAIYKQVSCP